MVLQHLIIMEVFSALKAREDNENKIQQQTNTYGAASSIAAGVSSAFADLDLTAGPCEAGPAGTGVAALAGVATSGSIHAGLVVSAVVQVWKDTTAHVD